MMKLAMVGEDFIHDYIYPGAINGFDVDAMNTSGGWMADMHRGTDGNPLTDAVRVSVIVSPDIARAQTIARTCRIEQVASHITSEIVDAVDGVLVMERDGDRHLELARPFIERGKFVYIDKPVVQRVTELDELRALAEQHDAKVLGGSAVRYSAQLTKALHRAVAVPPASIHIAGPGPWPEYGSHMVEAMVILLGPAVTAVTALGNNAAGAVIIGWADGRHGVIQYGRGHYPPGFTVQLFGSEEMFQINLDDAITYYRGVSERIVEVAKGAKSPSDWTELRTITQVMEQVGQLVIGK
ncbi:Gfo/Idh/MocA family oxidoreductase [Alicyclobacillus curvatus]|nr:Gfo/Idh/MocA family oxidoreductase [Alicyclobacillus curvatus]